MSFNSRGFILHDLQNIKAVGKTTTNYVYFVDFIFVRNPVRGTNVWLLGNLDCSGTLLQFFCNSIICLLDIFIYLSIYFIFFCLWFFFLFVCLFETVK